MMKNKPFVVIAMQMVGHHWLISDLNAKIPVDKEAIPEDITNTDITMQYFSFEVGSVVGCGLVMNIWILKFGIEACFFELPF